MNKGIINLFSDQSPREIVDRIIYDRDSCQGAFLRDEAAFHNINAHSLLTAFRKAVEMDRIIVRMRELKLFSIVKTEELEQFINDPKGLKLDIKQQTAWNDMGCSVLTELENILQVFQEKFGLTRSGNPRDEVEIPCSLPFCPSQSGLSSKDISIDWEASRYGVYAGNSSIPLAYNLSAPLVSTPRGSHHDPKDETAFGPDFAWDPSVVGLSDSVLAEGFRSENTTVSSWHPRSDRGFNSRTDYSSYSKFPVTDIPRGIEVHYPPQVGATRQSNNVVTQMQRAGSVCTPITVKTLCKTKSNSMVPTPPLKSIPGIASKKARSKTHTRVSTTDDRSDAEYGGDMGSDRDGETECIHVDPDDGMIPLEMLRLKKCEITPFSGSSDNWDSFIDIFDAAVHHQTQMSDSVKLSYLKAYTLGEAADLIKSYKTTNSNYRLAREQLKRRYANKRAILHSLFHKLLHLPSANSEADIFSLVANFHFSIRGIQNHIAVDCNFAVIFWRTF